MIANQNDAIATPPTVKNRSTWSMGLLCLTAAMTPRGIPSPAPSSSAANVSSRVAGSRWRISVETGRPDWMLVAEVSLHDLPEIDDELDDQRPIEPVPRADLGHLLRRRVLPGERRGGVVGDDPHEHEREHEQAEEHGNDEEEAPDDEPQHASAPDLRATPGRTTDVVMSGHAGTPTCPDRRDRTRGARHAGAQTVNSPATT